MKRIMIGIAAWALLAGACQPTARLKVSAEVRAVHDPAIVMDFHSDTLMYIRTLHYDYGKRHHFRPWGFDPLLTQVDIPRAQEGGLDAVFMGFVIHPLSERSGRCYHTVMSMFNTLDRVQKQNPKTVALARSADDIERIAAEGKLALLVGLEGGHMLDNSLDHLREYRDRGASYLGIVHQHSIEWAGSDQKASDKDIGLGEFGRQVVRECNRLGLMVDVSHANEKTFWDVIAAAQAPVIDSHTGCSAVKAHHRNLNDDQLRAIAKTGGVVGIIYYPAYLGPRMTGTIDEVVKTIDHAVEVAGVDHVGLGSDWDGFVSMPKGLADASQLPNLTRKLMERGYSAADIHKILGGNMLRVMREVQAKAKELGGQ